MEQKSIREQKREARAEARARLAGCTPEDTARWGEAMFEYLRVLPVWNTARTVMCFVSTPSEPDTRPLLQAALRQGRAHTRCEGSFPCAALAGHDQNDLQHTASEIKNLYIVL